MVVNESTIFLYSRFISLITISSFIVMGQFAYLEEHSGKRPIVLSERKHVSLSSMDFGTGRIRKVRGQTGLCMNTGLSIKSSKKAVIMHVRGR
ncbi:hypothetical protein HanXRQr2_Chr04g0189551 [Helianthus annuus]|uniref:Uncharacterized protein n=1 Tax=Helianthus annuus TaxID=4232 RepID=A0A9K3JD68_HELAN|nr:hypothetical protein HanXRQr2_Chr04g0189551 [Helianthus annuus]KAJ0933295.1 hypothetical protein HanPSC8_Chr04g0183181 [Helianthus annuus]